MFLFFFFKWVIMDSDCVHVPRKGWMAWFSPLPPFFDFPNLPSPPPPCAWNSLDPHMSVFYFPKDVLITTGFASRPYSSAAASFLFLNIPLFLLPFRLFLLCLWQISPSFYSHKHRACIHPNTSAGVSRTFSLKFSVFCVSPLWTSTTFICWNVKMLLCTVREQIFFLSWIEMWKIIKSFPNPYSDSPDVKKHWLIILHTYWMTLNILFKTLGMFCCIFHLFQYDLEKTKVPHFWLFNS